MKECDRCGALVTDRYAKVFGDNSGSISGCPTCTEVYATDYRNSAGD